MTTIKSFSTRFKFWCGKNFNNLYRTTAASNTLRTTAVMTVHLSSWNASVHCREEGGISKYTPGGPRDFPKAGILHPEAREIARNGCNHEYQGSPHLPSISCHIHQCVYAFLNRSNVLQSVVLHVHIFVSQE